MPALSFLLAVQSSVLLLNKKAVAIHHTQLMKSHCGTHDYLSLLASHRCAKIVHFCPQKCQASYLSQNTPAEEPCAASAQEQPREKVQDQTLHAAH